MLRVEPGRVPVPSMQVPPRLRPLLGRPQDHPVSGVEGRKGGQALQDSGVYGGSVGARLERYGVRTIIVRQ